MHFIYQAICLSIISKLVLNVDLKEAEDNNDLRQEQVVVRAVFINCEPNDEPNYLENESARFQREEQFKHSALQGCNKKLALTVKMVTEPDKNSGDEYIPVEHVFDGSNKRRARLLNPYILRLRRDSPVQAYKLNRIDTVSGILSKSSDYGSSKFKKSRIQRNLHDSTDQAKWRQHLGDANGHKSEDGAEINVGSNQCFIPEATANSTAQVATIMSRASTINEKYLKHYDNIGTHNRVKRDGCTLANNPAWKRDKRHEHNIIVEDVTDDYRIPFVENNRFYRKLDISSSANLGDKSSLRNNYDDGNYLKASQTDDPHLYRASHNTRSELNQPSSKKAKSERFDLKDNPKTTTTKLRKTDHTRENVVKNTNKRRTYDSPEKNFILYDIGNPDLWYAVHVQLFEKISTPEGKTVWNDITKGEVASVSSVQPEWMDQDVNVKYKPTEWISKDEFSLPVSNRLCLLVPLLDESPVDPNESTDNVIPDIYTFGKYIVVHKDDIVDVEPQKQATKTILSKRDGNYSDFTASIPEPKNQNEQAHRRVLVRVSRALTTGNDDDMRISTLGSDHFLTLPHQRPHHAQIDLEARADENQLIRVGSSGSIINVVADNSRRIRSVITVQAINKGLAAARFRVKARDCGPEMASLLNEKEEVLVAGPTMMPPRHTQRFRLELPVVIPVDTVHCSVALINDDEESVAVRDVAIKKGDRCFCVWHCECVCLKEDPKLICREMADTRQVAAGLSPRERTRRARSVCYPDVVTINLFVVIIGVILALLILGLVKASFGMFCGCVSKWGLDRLIQMPRKLDHYYEPALFGRPVVYDNEGWPVHPDTHKRNVRLISKTLEFILNILFFITVPCLMLYDTVRQIICRPPQQPGGTPHTRDNKNCFSTHDNMQGLQQLWHRRQRGGLRQWMTPHADDLSADIWSKGLASGKLIKCGFMRPLLHERDYKTGDVGSSCVDSEQDDTEYVLMQMQKSKESLAKSQKMLNESGTSSARQQMNNGAKTARSFTRHK